ncbi:MAG: adenosylcobinamide-GDP ribazoletransferase, partial [Anaerolineales bacterium]
FIRRPFTARELGRAVGFYPLVGLLLGAVLALVDLLLARILPVAVRSALILALWIVLTGALHFDGFVDSCDGLLGGATHDQRLAIMRDERAGAYGLAGGTLLLLILFSGLGAVQSLRWAVLLLAPVIGRWAMALSVVLFPYSRSAGLGRDIKDNAGLEEAALSTVIALLVVLPLAWWLQSVVPLAALGLAAAIGWLVSQFSISRIGGLTGDIYGAINMIAEASVVLAFAAAL